MLAYPWDYIKLLIAYTESGYCILISSIRQHQCVGNSGRGKKMQPLDIAMEVGAKERFSRSICTLAINTEWALGCFVLRGHTFLC